MLALARESPKQWTTGSVLKKGEANTVLTGDVGVLTSQIVEQPL